MTHKIARFCESTQENGLTREENSKPVKLGQTRLKSVRLVKSDQIGPILRVYSVQASGLSISNFHSHISIQLHSRLLNCSKSSLLFSPPNRQIPQIISSQPLTWSAPKSSLLFSAQNPLPRSPDRPQYPSCSSHPSLQSSPDRPLLSSVESSAIYVVVAVVAITG